MRLKAVQSADIIAAGLTMSLYGRVNSVYRLLPVPARGWAQRHAPDSVRRLRRRIVSRLERVAETDELYDGHYYDHVVDPLMLASADAIARSIKGEFEPRSVIDVGCGTGALMLSLERLGISCLGFDRASASLARCAQRGVDARRLDIEQDAFPTDRADLVVSTEVAEHLPESTADRFVELLTTLAPVAVVTAALPDSRGKDHVNEQPNEYWIAKFGARGFAYDRELAMRLRAEWRAAEVDEVFFKSLMVFRASNGR
jgi:SAM-dependent methyltransferase